MVHWFCVAVLCCIVLHTYGEDKKHTAMKIIIATQNGAASGTTATQFLLRRIFRVFCPFIFSWSRIVLQLCCFAPFCVAERFILGVFSSCLRPSCLGDSFNDSFDCIFYVGCVATTNSFFVVLDRMTRR